ncbi:MAG TPA: alpha-amylase family protein [Candidatus Bathyarchaeia archaeon]|nr:alpha-amylase family protein [Candidatus Bathyarchaeia archaeon]
MKVAITFAAVLLLIAGVAATAETVEYVAGQEGGVLLLIEDAAAPYQWQELDGTRVVGHPVNADFFQRSGLRFRVNAPLPEDTAEVTLVIEYLDSSIGLITVRYDSGRDPDGQHPGENPAYTGAAALAGYTCLGTGRPRTAVFQIAGPTWRHRQKGETDFVIEGVRALRRVTLVPGTNPAAVEAAIAQIPTKISPRVVLERPMQLVTTASARIGYADDLPATLDRMRELCPVVRALGFNAVESYVAWGNVEMQKGQYDWCFYDGVAQCAKQHGLRWFPLLIGGSAYALPDWYHDSPENAGFVCLEHGKHNNIQSIFFDNQNKYVEAFLKAFGAHYVPMDVLLGVRLGASGNFGESQYPAGGNWGFKGERDHIHIGWWAGDAHAVVRFREFLESKYGDIAALNAAWQTSYATFEEIPVFVPQFAENMRQRKDFVDWYMGAMSQWCGQFGRWTRAALPNTPVYESSGGWGFVESGTDFTDQTINMANIKGGIRCTNETDSYAQNFYATRMLSSAARFYGVSFGSEPAGYGSGRGIAARIYNILVNNGQHLFFYESNLLYNDQGTDQWLDLAPLLDQRAEPVIDVAALYPDTKSKLDDAVFRNLYAFTFNERVAALRPHLDFDFCSEQMILDGALPRYKVLVFLWSNIVEADPLNRIDAWVRAGGTVIFPYWGAMPLATVEGDVTVYNRWLRGETGNGKVIFDRGDRVPTHRYADFIAKQLDAMDNLDPQTLQMLRAQKPPEVYVSALQSGVFAVLNYNDEPAEVVIPDVGRATVKPYGIQLISR